MSVLEHITQAESKSVTGCVKDNGKGNRKITPNVKLIRVRDVIEGLRDRVVLLIISMLSTGVFGMIITTMVMVIMIVLGEDKSSA